MSSSKDDALTPIVGNVAHLALRLEKTVDEQAKLIAALTARVQATEKLIQEIHQLSIEEFRKG